MSDIKITAVIPVRAGSQRVKNKNLRPFGNTNLLELKIKTLKKVDEIDNIIVSSDSDEMLELATKLGVKTHKRDSYYASSECPNYKFWQHLAEKVVDTDYFMMANCVAPFIKVNTYKAIIATFRNNINNNDCITTVENVKDFIWDADKIKAINYDGNLAPNSQNLPDLVKLTFAITIVSRHYVIDNCNIIGNNPMFYRLDQLEATDIDTMHDFVVAELLYKNGYYKE